MLNNFETNFGMAANRDCLFALSAMMTNWGHKNPKNSIFNNVLHTFILWRCVVIFLLRSNSFRTTPSKRTINSLNARLENLTKKFCVNWDLKINLNFHSALITFLSPFGNNCKMKTPPTLPLPPWALNKHSGHKGPISHRLCGRQPKFAQ